MNVAKTTLILLTLSLLAEQSTALLHPNLRGFSLEVEKFEKPRYLLEPKDQDEKKERESPTTINLLDTVAAPEFQYTYAFARSMALSADGSCLVVGQSGAGPSSHGKVYVYTRQQDSTWQIAAVLSKDFATHVDMFASTIDVSAQCTRIVVGDPCPGHGYTSYKRVLLYDVDEDGEWNTTASLRHGTPLASGGQLELSSPASREFGRQVMMSEDGRRILIQAPAANGGIFDVDLEGSVLPVGNETASALSADGNRIVSTIVDDRGNDEYAVSVRVLDYDAVADDWISYGNGVLIGMTRNSRPRLQSIINGQGSRLFLKTFLIDTWEVFVIDDTGSGFGVVQLLGQIAQEAGADLSSNAFDTDYNGNLLVVGSVLLQQENGSWDSLVTAGLDESVGLAAVSSDGSTVASRSFDSELQQDVVKVYGISTGDVPEPTVKPTAEPTPELSAQVKYFDSVMVGGGDRGFNSMYGFLLNTDGSCLVLGRPSYVPGIGGRVYVYRPQVDSTWVLSAEFGDDEGANSTSTDWFGDNVAVSADCTRIVASGTQGIGDRVAIFDLDNSGQWNLKARLWNGSRLVNGDFLELPPSSAVWFGSRVAISDDGKRVAVSASRTTTIYVFDVDYDGNIALLGDPIDAGFVGLSSDGARVLAHTTGGIGTFQYDQSQGQWAPLEDVLVLTKGGNPPLVINGAADRLARIEVEGYLYTILVYDNTGNGLHFAKDLREVALQDGVSFSNQTNLAYPADIDITESGKLIVAKPIPTGTPGIPVLVFREGAERGSWQLAAQVPPPPGIQFTTTSYGIVVSGDGSTMAVFSALEDSRQWLISVFGISTEDGDDDDKMSCGPTRQKACIDFSSTDERDLVHGDYVEHDWFGTYGMTLAVSSFNGGYLAQGARVFDTSRPDTRDPDLGSPNELCTPAGPGVGLGGVPGSPGENCLAQGNVLIIQQDNGPDDTEPDDNAYGGTIEFMFDDEGRKVLSIGMLDIDSHASLKIRKYDGSYNEIKVEGLGDNAFQEESIGEEDVSSLEFSIAESGAVSYLCICDDPSVERIAVELIPAELAIPAPGQEVTFLAKVKHHAGDSDVTITTILETSIGDLNGRGTCSTPQTIAPNKEYSCTFLSSVSGPSGTTVTKIIAATGINKEGIALLDTATAVVTLIGAAPTPQETCIRFDETPDGTKLNHGDWVKDQWFDQYGMMIIAASTDGGYTPDGQARIFNTKLYNTQDVDLGSPNQDCVGGGPGVGHGGVRGAPGENCEPQGNILIIQEHPEPNEDYDLLEPDDNAYGGSLTFTFDTPPKKLTRVGLMDIEVEEDAFYKITRASGAPVEKRITGLGDNSVQEETINVENVTSLELSVSNSIGVRYICFQQSDSTSTEQPTLEPTQVPTPAPTPDEVPISREEVAMHRNVSLFDYPYRVYDCWMVLYDSVYNLTNYGHRGVGPTRIQWMYSCGSDGTGTFEAHHPCPEYSLSTLSGRRIGPVEGGNSSLVPSCSYP